MDLGKDNIPGMDSDKKGNYSTEKPIVPDQEKVNEEMDKTKKELEKLKKYIKKNHSYTLAVGVLPPQSIQFFIEEEEVPKETEKHVHLVVLVPEKQYKNLGKIKKDLVKKIEEIKDQKIWLHVKTPVDVWEYCMDSKFEIVEAVAMSYPIFDEGILGALRVASIHKSMVLRKFEKYVVSYVIGGSLVRGDAVKTSDVDVFVIINDTDVKRMPRLELREKLRSIIYKYIAEASALAGVKNLLNVQVSLLTDFWERVKDAEPVVFTFIRDGVPLYDRGTFLPWKALLRMGKLKPTPESIDMFMSYGDKTVKRVKRTLMDLVMNDIYWGVMPPSQALLMLYGLPPPNVKETVKEMKRIFVDKEKLLEKKYTDILHEIAIKYYKGYEHQKVKEVTGAEVDKLLKNTEEYLKRLKELREQIEKRIREKTTEELEKEVFELVKHNLNKKAKSKTAMIKAFEEEFVKTGKFTKKHLSILKNVAKGKVEAKKKNANLHKIDKIRRDATSLINDLIEYSQRCELANLEKGRMILKYKASKDDKDYTKTAEILTCEDVTYLFKDNQVKKIDAKSKTAKPVKMEEVNKALEKQKSSGKVEISGHVFEVLKKELGDFEVVM